MGKISNLDGECLTNKNINHFKSIAVMRVYQTNEIKNIALVGSAGSGKTTLAESMLFEAGLIKRRGTVEAKNTDTRYFQRYFM